MDIEKQRQILREQKAGYAFLRAFNIEEMRNATFEDRLDGLCQVLELGDALNKPDPRTDDDEFAQRWTEIIKRFEARNEHPTT
jgi:hypothetical protein